MINVYTILAGEKKDRSALGVHVTDAAKAKLEK